MELGLIKVLMMSVKNTFIKPIPYVCGVLKCKDTVADLGIWILRNIMSPSAKLLLMLYLQQSRIASVLQILVPGDTIIISFYNKTDYKAFLCSTEPR